MFCNRLCNFAIICFNAHKGCSGVSRAAPRLSAGGGDHQDHRPAPAADEIFKIEEEMPEKMKPEVANPP